MTARQEVATSHSSTDFPVAHAITREIWSGLGREESALEGLRFSGEGDLRSPFPVADFAAATFAAAGLATGELLRSGGHPRPELAVDRRTATVWFDIPLAPTRYVDESERHGIHSTWMAEFVTKDGRWLRTQATYPTLRRRMMAALGVEGESLEGVARLIREMTADEAEALLVSGGAAVAQARTIAEWNAHPQGAAVAEEPIAAVRTTTETTSAWRPLPERPLQGIRVLDFSRVVAAPMATRFLAALGAEVLRIDAPWSDEATFGDTPNDVMLGKRWALLDVRTTEGRARYAELLSTADIMVHSYRPGAIDSLGFTEDERAQIRPGLVEVVLDAYGWTGPWAGRRGFDTLVQYSSGIAAEVSRWANEQPESRLPLNCLGSIVDASRPRHLPVEALDFGSGYQLAAAALSGLARRVSQGVGSVSKLSLARSAQLLTSAAAPAHREEFGLPLDAPYVDDRVWNAGGRPSKRIDFPLRIDGVPLYWERPAERAGASTPMWSSVPAQWRQISND